VSDPGPEESARLRRELEAVDLERRRLRSELQQIRSSPLGPLIEPARIARVVAQRWLGRLRRLLGRGRRGAGEGAAPRPGLDRPKPLPPRLSGSELAWLARRRLRRRADRWSTPVPPQAPSGEWLTPILVDYFGRDGSTLLMALLATSPQIVIDEKYPYERRYFTYLWRWSRLLARTDWPGALWTKDDVVSISQEREAPGLLGPPPWLPRELLEPGPDGVPIARRCFELGWAELSARASDRARSGGRPGPRYYAEKHVNTWLVDAGELPPVRLLVLLRDPRDIYASIQAFEQRDPTTSFGIQDAWAGADRLAGIVERHRQRLRWIAGLLDEGEVPVIRYGALTEDLGRVARRVGQHLGIELDPDALRTEELASRHGSSATNGRGRWQRDLDSETAERFTRELGPELEAVGLRS
jgi:Sulfotransferase domain